MATFAKATFNASGYSSFRPNYPHNLFREVFGYHGKSKNARWDLAIDLGCGTGQATSQLQAFKNVIGIDPSLPMIENARREYERNGLENHTRFTQSNAEDLSGTIADSSVDMIISAQAAHWFDWGKMWPEVKRVLRPGGTAAFWTYSEFRLSNFPSVTPIITAFAQGSDPKTSLGPHFQRPGRTILENHLLDVPDPIVALKDQGGGLGNFQRVFYAGNHILNLPLHSTVRQVQMRKEMRWRDLLGYFRTWSPLQSYHELFPEDLKREDDRFPEDLKPSLQDGVKEESITGGYVDVDVHGGDIAVRFWKDLREGVKREGGRYGVDETVLIEWPIALLLVNRV